MCGQVLQKGQARPGHQLESRQPANSLWQKQQPCSSWVIFSRKAQLKQQVPRIPTHALRCAVLRLDLPRSSSLLESTHLMWWPVGGGPSRWHVTCGNPAPTLLTQPAFLVSVLFPQSSCRFDRSFCALHPATVHCIISGPGQSMCLATTAVRA